MANFHTKEWIMVRLKEHYNEALEYFPKDRIVGIFLQGSQNHCSLNLHTISNCAITANTFVAASV